MVIGGQAAVGKGIVQGVISAAILSFFLASCVNRDEGPGIVSLQDGPDRELGVRLTFGDRTAWFMFDTGAGTHGLARWFVEAAGLEIDDSLVVGVPVLDGTGAPVEVRAMQRQVGWLPDGDSLVIESAVVAEFAPYFQQAEVGGLLNPQLLAGDGQATVLDLRVPELRIEPWDDALHRVGASVVADNQIRICTDTDTPLSNQQYAVLVAARGSEAWLVLDTGAGRTKINAESALVRGLTLEPGGEVMGVTGRPQGYSVARDLMISFGGA